MQDGLNQNDVMQMLNEVHQCKEPFTVEFSGKKSRSRNGFYRPATREIVINNRNYITEDGLNESMLMYTALHELAHHIQYTEYEQTGSRSHTKLFHSILDDLADKAEAAGIYKPVIDSELKELINEAQTISRAIANLQRDLGNVINKLHEACLAKGVRMEDLVKRKAHISLESAKKAQTIAVMDLPEGISADIQEIISSERDGVKRRAMALAAQAGKSAAQVKCVGASTAVSQTSKGEREMENLLLEKGRLERTIETLQRRLREVMKQINSDSGLRSGCAAERINT